jgi:uncharacterized protein with PQ loop repeat
VFSQAPESTELHGTLVTLPQVYLCLTIKSIRFISAFILTCAAVVIHWVVIYSVLNPRYVYFQIAMQLNSLFKKSKVN